MSIVNKPRLVASLRALSLFLNEGIVDKLSFSVELTLQFQYQVDALEARLSRLLKSASNPR